MEANGNWTSISTSHCTTGRKASSFFPGQIVGYQSQFSQERGQFGPVSGHCALSLPGPKPSGEELRGPVAVPANLYQEERMDLHVCLTELPSETELEGERHCASGIGVEMCPA